MLLGRAGEARAIYLRHRGVAKAQAGKSWEDLVLDDFAALRKAGFASPVMDEIEETFSQAKAAEQSPAQPSKSGQTVAPQSGQAQAAQPAQVAR